MTLLVGLLLTGCARRSVEPVTGEPADFVERVSLTLNGLGPVSADTPFRAAAVSALLPGYAVEMARYGDAAQTQVLLVDLDDDRVAELFATAGGDTVGRIDVLSDAVEGPFGEHVGQRLDEVSLPGIGCAPGGESLPRMVVCSPAGSDRVDYLFRLPRGASTNTSTLPARSTLDRARLVRMVWRGERGTT